LGIHLKPIGLLNIRGYFDKLLEFVEHVVGEGFLKPAHRDALVVEEQAEKLVTRLREHELTYIDKLR
jgi:predicted Rossmann-fold nucleotide-binding protein